MTPLNGMSLCIHPVYWLRAKLTFGEADTSSQHTPPLHTMYASMLPVHSIHPDQTCAHTRTLMTYGFLPKGNCIASTLLGLGSSACDQCV